MKMKPDNYYRSRGRKPPPIAREYMRPKAKSKNREYLLLFLFFLFSYYFFLNYGIIKVSGNSMRPTLEDGAYYLAAKINNGKIHNGDIICAQTDDGLVIKRILGSPGDSINIDTNGKIYRNSSYIGWINYRPINVTLGEYYLLSGDNRGETETYFVPRSNLFFKPLFID